MVIVSLCLVLIVNKGTADGGKTVRNSDKSLDSIMKQAAHVLNLKAHEVVGTADQKSVTLYGPADLEGHFGKDGKSRSLFFLFLTVCRKILHHRHCKIVSSRSFSCIPDQ